mmetsp:Transcript_71905/g.233737  ORF Transcript_71905/g.233737 Transcript_71905/m.233737 type:complete len:397 (+) Transcript_71905:101-1291(+)
MMGMMSCMSCTSCAQSVEGEILIEDADVGAVAEVHAQGPTLLGRGGDARSEFAKAHAADLTSDKAGLISDKAGAAKAFDGSTPCSTADVGSGSSGGEAASSPTDQDCQEDENQNCQEVDEPADAIRAPEVRAQLSDKDLAAVKALEIELGESGVDIVRAALVPGEALESCLMRFLRASDMKPRPAAKALRAMLAWRATARPDELASRSAGDVAGCPEELLDQYMPTWHQGFDKKGRPVIFSHYGKFRFGPVLEAGVTVEKIMQLHVRSSEHTARLCGEQSSKLGHDISNALIIMDTQGWDSNNLKSKGAFDWARGMAKSDTEYYPERMGQLIIINAPSSVNYFYRAVSWALSEKARDKIKIFAGREQWEPALLELVDASQLSPEYGGSAPSPDVSM